MTFCTARSPSDSSVTSAFKLTWFSGSRSSGSCTERSGLLRSTCAAKDLLWGSLCTRKKPDRVPAIEVSLALGKISGATMPIGHPANCTIPEEGLVPAGSHSLAPFFFKKSGASKEARTASVPSRCLATKERESIASSPWAPEGQDACRFPCTEAKSTGRGRCGLPVSTVTTACRSAFTRSCRFSRVNSKDPLPDASVHCHSGVKFFSRGTTKADSARASCTCTRPMSWAGCHKAATLPSNSDSPARFACKPISGNVQVP